MHPHYTLPLVVWARVVQLIPSLSTTAQGDLPELIDVIVASGATLFVTAVGVAPKWVVDRLHANNITCMNMVGAPKHVAKVCARCVQ